MCAALPLCCPAPQMVCEATTAQDERIRISAFSCLHEIAANYYGKLPNYMTEIFNISVKAIQGDSEDVALQVRLQSVKCTACSGIWALPCNGNCKLAL